MAELTFETDQYGTHAKVDGLEIAHYTDIGEGRVRVYVDGHKHPLCFKRHAVADSERQARHWIRTWWARDQAEILAGFSKLERERKAQLIENQDPSTLWRAPEMAAASARPKRSARRRPPRL
jgi:hypothetical protein